MFSEILRDLRAKKRFSQKQLAEIVGVSPGNVSDWESGKTKPGYVALAALARCFEVSADYLLELSPEKTGEVEDDLRRLRFVRQAQTAGFTLEEIKELMDLDAGDDRETARKLAKVRLEALDARIAELDQARNALKRLVGECVSGKTGPCRLSGSDARRSLRPDREVDIWRRSIPRERHDIVGCPWIGAHAQRPLWHSCDGQTRESGFLRQ